MSRYDNLLLAGRQSFLSQIAKRKDPRYTIDVATAEEAGKLEVSERPRIDKILATPIGLS